MQNFRFRNFQTDRRHRPWRCPHSDARHHFLDGTRGRSYAEERLQLQNWYLECRLRRSWDVGRNEALDGWRDRGSYVQGIFFLGSSTPFRFFDFLHSCSNQNCHHLCRRTSFWVRKQTTLDRNVSPCTISFFWPLIFYSLCISKKVTLKSVRLQRSSENIPISCSQLIGNLLDSLNQKSQERFMTTDFIFIPSPEICIIFSLSIFPSETSLPFPITHTHPVCFTIISIARSLTRTFFYSCFCEAKLYDTHRVTNLIRNALLCLGL